MEVIGPPRETICPKGRHRGGYSRLKSISDRNRGNSPASAWTCIVTKSNSLGCGSVPDVGSPSFPWRSLSFSCWSASNTLVVQGLFKSNVHFYSFVYFCFYFKTGLGRSFIGEYTFLLAFKHPYSGFIHIVWESKFGGEPTYNSNVFSAGCGAVPDVRSLVII